MEGTNPDKWLCHLHLQKLTISFITSVAVKYPLYPLG